MYFSTDIYCYSDVLTVFTAQSCFKEMGININDINNKQTRNVRIQKWETFKTSEIWKTITWLVIVGWAARDS